MTLHLSTRRMLRALALTILVLVLAHVAVWVAVFTAGIDHETYWVEWFDLDCEHNVPTLFSTFEFLCCAGLLWATGIALRRLGKRYVAWLALGALFIVLAMDDMASFHDALIDPLRAALHAQGALRQAWVIPYGAGVLVLGAVLLPWFFRLPAVTRRRFFVAGALYLAGALGCEMLGALNRSWHSGNLHTPSTAVICGLEETLEMVGLLAMLRALLLHVGAEFGGLRLVIGAPAIPEENAAHAAES